MLIHVSLKCKTMFIVLKYKIQMMECVLMIKPFKKLSKFQIYCKRHFFHFMILRKKIPFSLFKLKYDLWDTALWSTQCCAFRKWDEIFFLGWLKHYVTSLPTLIYFSVGFFLVNKNIYSWIPGKVERLN